MSLRFPNSEYLSDDIIAEIVEDQSVKSNSVVLPFEPLDRDAITPKRLDGLLRRDTNAEGITVVYLGQFESEKAQELVEKAVIQLSLDNDPLTLKVWKLLDHDDDIEYVSALEDKYGVKLENLRATAHLFSLTYDMWSLARAEYETEEGKEKVEARLPNIVEKAKALSNFELDATHQVQDSSFIFRIKIEQTLRGSSGEKFEGAGVYAGILGGYKEWKKAENTIFFKVNLGDTFPIITDRADPEAMVVILSDEVDIHKGSDSLAEPIGEIIWENDEYHREVIDEWKLTLFKKYVQVETANIVEQTDGSEALFIQSDDKPIIWASVAKALKIFKVVKI